MSIKKVGKMVTVWVYPNQLADFDNYAQSRGMNRSDMIRHVVSSHIAATPHIEP